MTTVAHQPISQEEAKVFSTVPGDAIHLEDAWSEDLVAVGRLHLLFFGHVLAHP